MSSGIHIDALDRREGNGSRNNEEDWLDEQSSEDIENEWSSAETTFYYWEADEHNQFLFKELYDKQHGKGKSSRKEELQRMRAMADTKAFCSMLELSRPLRERVSHIMERIDISSKNSGGKSYEKMILAVISLVHDEHLSSMPPADVDYQQRMIFNETFRELMESANIGSKELRSVRQQIREKSAFF